MSEQTKWYCPNCGNEASKVYQHSATCHACKRLCVQTPEWLAALQQRAEAAEQRVRDLEATDARAKQEAADLAVTIHRRHYWEVKQWGPLDYTAGIISQIDNMVAGILNDFAALKASAPVWRSMAGEDEWPKVGQKVLLRSSGVVQEEIYTFDESDTNDFGGICYFWSRDDLDECPEIKHDDCWMPLPVFDPLPTDTQGDKG